MQFAILPFLILAAGAMADKKINYSCKYANQGMAQPQRKAGGTQTDDYAQTIVDNMSTWSNSRYSATFSNAVSNLVNVQCVDLAANKSEAADNVNDMQQIVNQHRP